MWPRAGTARCGPLTPLARPTCTIRSATAGSCMAAASTPSPTSGPRARRCTSAVRRCSCQAQAPLQGPQFDRPAVAAAAAQLPAGRARGRLGGRRAVAVPRRHVRVGAVACPPRAARYLYGALQPAPTHTPGRRRRGPRRAHRRYARHRRHHGTSRTATACDARRPGIGRQRIRRTSPTPHATPAVGTPTASGLDGVLALADSRRVTHPQRGVRPPGLLWRRRRGDYGPYSLGDWENLGAHVPADWLTDGFDGYVVGDNPGVAYLLRGAQAITYDMAQGTANSQYIATVEPDWPLSWNPILQQAPSGRTTGLWSVTPQGDVMSFDGTQWTRQPVSMRHHRRRRRRRLRVRRRLERSDPARAVEWRLAGTRSPRHSSILAQVSVGNQGWSGHATAATPSISSTRASSNPFRWSVAATHLAANHDGTLWSCNGSDPQAARLASDLGVAPATVAAPGPVQKVASTGFGVAHCLVASDRERPFSATTRRMCSGRPAATPSRVAIPSNRVWAACSSSSRSRGSGPSQPTTFFVVALDAHTGQELSRSAVAPPGLRYTPPVFDPLHETLIVGLTTNTCATGQQPGQLLGSGRSRPEHRCAGPSRCPTTCRSARAARRCRARQLCVSDNVNTLLMYDTGAAPTPRPRPPAAGRQLPVTRPQDDHRLPPPVLANGQVYAAWWVFSRPRTASCNSGCGSWTRPPDGHAERVRRVPLDLLVTARWPSDRAGTPMGAVPPCSPRCPAPRPGSPARCCSSMAAPRRRASTSTRNTVQYYDLPGSNASRLIASGFGFANGVLWFGDNGSSLHGVDGQT